MVKEQPVINLTMLEVVPVMLILVNTTQVIQEQVIILEVKVLLVINLAMVEVVPVMLVLVVAVTLVIQEREMTWEAIK